MSDGTELSITPGPDGSIPAVVNGQGRLYRLIDTAVDTLRQLMTDDEQEGYVRLNAANSALDRVGLGKKSTVDHHHDVTHGLDPQIQQLMERLRRRDVVVPKPEIAPPIVNVVGEEDDDIEEAEIVPPSAPQQSVVLDFEEFRSRPPDEI